MHHTTKTRNRERRTKPSREAVTFQIKASREIYEHVKSLETKYGIKRDEIFLLGLNLCDKRLGQA